MQPAARHSPAAEARLGEAIARIGQLPVPLSALHVDASVLDAAAAAFQQARPPYLRRPHAA